jgi:hypothetical protein
MQVVWHEYEAEVSECYSWNLEVCSLWTRDGGKWFRYEVVDYYGKTCC